MTRSRQPGNPELKRKGALIGMWRDRVLSSDGPKDPSGKLVALAVAKFLNADSMQTFVSVATLAEATGLNEKTVRRQVTALLAGRWLTAEAMPSKGWVKPRILRLALPPITAGTAPAEGQRNGNGSAGTMSADAAGITPGDAAGTMPGEETAGIAPGEQRASCPPTADIDDAHSGHWSLPQRAPCPPNSENLINTGEHGARARRLKGPAQGAEKTPESELAGKVRALAGHGSSAADIVRMLPAYNLTEATVQAWLADAAAVHATPEVA
ncbi:MAG: hypothetical protein R3E75_08220 [Steroidobacteraceae bacterium]|nr:hypothetical protein [Nevskiaceae bacterium]MCP5472282.1 hypothetical protein [Nevskiaceae bacterium]